MNSKLAAAGGGSKIIVYPDAGHGFFADYRPEYKRADAEGSWSEATVWLTAHGV
jgi:carboxymethylenebutenolidase